MLFLHKLILLFTGGEGIFGPGQYPMVYENDELMLYEDGTPMIYEELV